MIISAVQNHFISANPVGTESRNFKKISTHPFIQDTILWKTGIDAADNFVVRAIASAQDCYHICMQYNGEFCERFRYGFFDHRVRLGQIKTLNRAILVIRLGK